MSDKFLHTPPDPDLFASEPPRLDDALSRRLNADPESGVNIVLPERIHPNLRLEKTRQT